MGGNGVCGAVFGGGGGGEGGCGGDAFGAGGVGGAAGGEGATCGAAGGEGGTLGPGRTVSVAMLLIFCPSAFGMSPGLMGEGAIWVATVSCSE